MEKLPEIKYADQLILTTKQLAEFYETTVDRIKQNYVYNKDKFEEGKHYYEITGDELAAFKLQVGNSDLQISPMTRHLYLWTKRGASRHSKMLGTDRAWDMYDMLEENYFNPRPVKQLTATEQLKLATKSVVELDDRVTTLEDTMRVSGPQEKALQDAAKKCVFDVVGGKESNAYQKMGPKLFRQCWHDFKRHFKLPRYSELPRIQFDEGIQYLEAWLPDTETRIEIHHHNMQGELINIATGVANQRPLA
jgi:hypothetical protein